VVNDVTADGVGIDSDTNAATFLTATTSIELPRCRSGSLPIGFWMRFLRCAGRGRWWWSWMRTTIRKVAAGSGAERRGSAGAAATDCGVGELARQLDAATRDALVERVRFYRDLGLTEFYRRPVDAALLAAEKR
jgi:hypothetical protein